MLILIWFGGFGCGISCGMIAIAIYSHAMTKNLGTLTIREVDNLIKGKVGPRSRLLCLANMTACPELIERKFGPITEADVDEYVENLDKLGLLETRLDIDFILKHLTPKS